MITVFRPQPGPQTEFLSSAADIAIYGGAAGGGKSFAMLLEAARGTGNRQYAGVIFRRTSTQITAPGGMWEAAGRIYPLIGARARSSNNHLDYVFPSGARVAFRHLQHDKNKLDWMGAELAFIGFDELTHFEEAQFWYLMSRNRSTSGIRPYIRATCNPAPGWVRTLIAPWIDPAHDKPAKPGELRYFIRVDGELRWVDDSYRDARGNRAKSLTFIPSRITDNPALLEINPEYIATLEALPEIERRRLLEGDWNVFDGAFFAEFSEHRHCITPPYTPQNPPPSWWNYFGGLDWGFKDPFAFGLYGVDEDGAVHCIESVQRSGLTNPAQADVICGILAKWGIPKHKCLISYDPSMDSTRRAHMQPGLIGEPDIEDFYRAGLNCAPADNNRQGGWSHVRKFLHNTAKDGKPILRIWKGYNTDKVRLFPLAPFHETKAEDMAEGEWDHTLDETRYALATRPAPAIVPKDIAPKTFYDLPQFPGMAGGKPDPKRLTRGR